MNMESGYLCISEEIRKWVLNKIENGELKPGDKIPSTGYMVKQFGCASITVNKALKSFRDEGILTTFKGNPGRGTFVSKCYKSEHNEVPKEIGNSMEYKIKCEVSGIKVTVIPESKNGFTVLVQHI